MHTLSALKVDFRFTFAYHFAMIGLNGAMNAKPELPRSGNTIVIAAAIIAAVRLAKEPEINNTPRVNAKIAESVQLAMKIYERVESFFASNSTRR